MVDAVNRFYDSYYFRPRVAWRIVRDALWDGHERKRLYHEAVDFLKLRADRQKVARKGGVAKKAMVAVPAAMGLGTGSGGRRVAERMTSQARSAFQDFHPDSDDGFRGPLGDIFLGKGMKSIPPMASWAPADSSAFFSSAFTSGTIWIGIGLLLTFFIAYLLVLSWADYSYVLPASSISSLLIALLATFRSA